MNRFRYYILFIFLIAFGIDSVNGQGSFIFDNPSQKKVSLSFKLINNLTIFPMEVNGMELNFILDSGVGRTILFNLSSSDSLKLNNTRSIKLKGLGSEEPVDAILSDGNSYKLKGITGYNQKLFVIFDDSFDLSSKLGLTIHGIIGNDILKDFVVNINYLTKRLTLHNPRFYSNDKCKKCQFFKLEFNQNKPYVNVGVKMNEYSEKITPVKLLIDSGGSDAIWLFENSHPDIKKPEKSFRDYLGEGLSGTVFGARSYVKSLVMGDFELHAPTVSYPDSSSVANARKFVERNGSLGAGVLSRFSVTFDYNNRLIGLKKMSSFKKPFRYNMSGIELAYNGKILVREHDKSVTSFSINSENENNDSKIFLSYKYKYTFKPSYKIYKLREGSPAHRAGLLENDIIVKINGKYAHDMEIQDIVSKFYQKENTRINMVIERGGMNYTYKFHLENIFK